jgi:hypothetical protein
MKLKESAEIIQRLIKPTKDIQGTPCVFKIKDKHQFLRDKNKQYEMSVIWIPLHLVDNILQM